MGEALKRRIKQARFENPQQEALLNLVIAGNYIREQLERAVGEHGITLPQYNVLRILRGVFPEGHPRCEIATRMLDRAPDVTLVSLDGTTPVSLASQIGGKPTVLVFGSFT